jgi:hypothetical protein
MKRLATTLLCIIAATTTGAQNLLENSSFEYGTRADNWGNTWGTFILERWNTPPDGIFAAYIRGGWAGAGNLGGMMQSVTNIVPGTTYRVKGLFYFDQGWTAKNKALKIEFFDNAGSLLLAETNELTSLTDGHWVAQMISAVSPPASARAQIVIEASEIGGGGVLGADLVEMEAVVPEP